MANRYCPSGRPKVSKTSFGVSSGMLPTNNSSPFTRILPKLAALAPIIHCRPINSLGEDSVTLFIRALLCGALLALAVDANAQGWPSRPVKLIVPTGPGAATDVMARLLADGVSKTLGQPMVVENMPGASGIVAHQSAARAVPDGYTLLFTNTSGMAINLISFKQLPYEPTRDFTPVALVCSLGPQMLSVNAQLPVDSL